MPAPITLICADATSEKSQLGPVALVVKCPTDGKSHRGCYHVDGFCFRDLHLVEPLRQRILADYEASPADYDAEDISRLHRGDWPIIRFLMPFKDPNVSYEKLKASLRWRKKMGVNGFTSTQFPAEFFQVGCLFAHGQDRGGNELIILRIRCYQRIPLLEPLMKKYIVYVIDKMDREARAHGHGLGFIFDLQGVALQNVDMDILKFIITTLVNCYPMSLKYVLLHEMPWFCSTLWKIARSWLPLETRNIVRTSTSKDIHELIDKDNLPDFMGGWPPEKGEDPSYRRAPHGCLTVEQLAKKLRLADKQSDIDKSCGMMKELLKSSRAHLK